MFPTLLGKASGELVSVQCRAPEAHLLLRFIAKASKFYHTQTRKAANARQIYKSFLCQDERLLDHMMRMVYCRDLLDMYPFPSLANSIVALKIHHKTSL
mmetsp:Transcript_14722/g.21988  ORF Transcript_14722/g.21988 Transcript_14722/m.21988 type:complete len:99 (+) Transcript_14722:175-471(+)